MAQTLYNVLYIDGTSNTHNIASTTDQVKAEIIANNVQDHLEDIGEDDSRVTVLETALIETDTDMATAVNKFIAEY